MELSKGDKKHARALMALCVEKEFEIGLTKFDKILQDWKNKKVASRESYYAIFTKVKDFDKHIAYRYDDIRNSTLLFNIVDLYTEKLISDEDLGKFQESTILTINRILALRNS